MDFYNAMHSKNDTVRAVVHDEVSNNGEKKMDMQKSDGANFLNYQYSTDGHAFQSKTIPAEQKPSPKQLNDAISKRTDSPALRYISMLNKK